jgi:hypothetical protein
MTKKCAGFIQEGTTCSNDQTELWEKINKKLKDFKHDLCSTRPIFEIGGVKFDILHEFLKPPSGVDNQSNDYDELLIIKETDVAENIDKARGRLLPGFIPYSSAVSIIMKHQKKWKSPALECLREINEIMTNLVDNSTNRIFSRFPALVGRMKYV